MIIHREFGQWVEQYYFEKLISTIVDMFTLRYFEFIRDLAYSGRQLTDADVEQVCIEPSGHPNSIFMLLLALGPL